MIKRIVVTGSKYYHNYEEAKIYIDLLIKDVKQGNTLIFASCGCEGIETLAERYAEENGYEIERYPTLWEPFGSSGGAVRNKQRLNTSDLIICLWDGIIGETCSVMEYAELIGKEVKVLRIHK